MRFFLIFLFLVPLQVSAAKNLIIVEVQVRGDSPDNSFIKIYNLRENALDISGYRIRKRSSTGGEYSVRVFPKESVIDSHGYFLWANSRDNYHLSLNADVYSTASISQNNSIALVSSDGEVIDALAWGDGENQFVLGNPFPHNPQKEEAIRRTKNDNYQNTKDNSQDFYLFPEKESLVLGQETKEMVFQKNERFPLTQSLSFALVMGFLALVCKKRLNSISL